MKIWILGAGGQLGQAIAEVCGSEKIPYVASTHSEADITNLEQLKWMAEQILPTHLINCAAYPDVDGAEKNVEHAYTVNALGTENVGIIGRELGIKVVHVSTDYVFDGENDRPYLETDRPNPIGVYGKSKLEGELRLLEQLGTACIVRTSWIFGQRGKNFLSSILTRLQRDEHIQADTDQINRATYNCDLAQALIDLSCQSGIFHFANGQPASRYQIVKDFYTAATERNLTVKCQKISPISAACPIRRNIQRLIQKRSRSPLEENLEYGKLYSENISMPIFKRILVTGGAGFIGSAFINFLFKNAPIERVVNLDLLTFVANLKNLSSVEKDPRYRFVHGNILNSTMVKGLIKNEGIEAIVHFAAESHVDRSIEDPLPFYRTNVEGTIALLEVVREFPHVRFHHVSTDEVFGSIEKGEFTEESPYRPNSPYAASKAASDHFVRAYAMTYDLLVTLSHSSNNYGPSQFREKFIPRMIYGMLRKEPLPVYGNGVNVRDWIHVDDHVEAIWQILQNGKIGEAYNVGSRHEMRNIDLLNQLIDCFAKAEREASEKYRSLITYVKDRPGHDFRYALNAEKIERELGWKPTRLFDQGLETTMEWYRHVWK